MPACARGLQPSQTFAPVFSADGLGLRRSVRRTACLAIYRARQPLACGCGWGELPWGHGRGAGRHRWAGAREKWLYFSYTLNVGSYSEAYALYKLYVLG